MNCNKCKHGFYFQVNYDAVYETKVRGISVVELVASITDAGSYCDCGCHVIAREVNKLMDLYWPKEGQVK